MRSLLLQRIINKLVSAIPVSILIFGLSLTLFSAYYIDQTSQKKELKEFTSSSKVVEKRIKDSAAFYSTLLFSSRSYLYTNENVSQEDFGKFSKNLHTGKSYSGIDGIGYVSTVPNSQKVDFVEELRINGEVGELNNQVVEQPPSQIVVYLEPQDLRNQAMIGLDFSLQRTLNDAMNRAKSEGVVASSGRILLQQPMADQPEPSFVSFLPVYNSSSLPNVQEDRLREPKGFVFIIFNVKNFFQQVFSEDGTAPINFNIYENTSETEKRLIYSSEIDDEYEPRLKLDSKIDILGKSWVVSYTNKASSDITSVRHSVPMLVIVGLLLTAIIYVTTESQIKARFIAERTQKKLLEAQSEVQASEEKLRLLIQESKEYAIVMLGKTGRIVSWNSGAEQLFGFYEAEILNKDYAILFTDKERKKRVHKKELTTALQTNCHKFERHFVAKNGDKFWLSGVLSTVYGNDHDFKGFALIARDVSDRKKWEEALLNNQQQTQAILDSLRSGVVVINRLGQVIAFNQAWEKMRAHNLANVQKKLALGENLIEALQKSENVDNEDSRLALKGIQKVINKSVSHFDLEYRIADVATEERWYELQVTPLKQEEDRVVIAYTNISERKKLEKQKDDFLRIASHELKTPITSTKAYAQVLIKMLSGKKEDAATVKLLVKMDQQLNKVTKLINDLLDVSKIEAGLLKLNNEYFEFDILVNEVVESVQLTNSEHKIVVRGKTKKRLYSDPERLGQVLTNLLINAIKFSSNKRHIHLTCEVREDQIVVEVKDSGVGISEDDQKNLFQRFFRVQAPEFQGQSGLGLGLYISAEIINRLGGEIGVKSELGKGSTFYFSLPVENEQK